MLSEVCVSVMAGVHVSDEVVAEVEAAWIGVAVRVVVVITVEVVVLVLLMLVPAR